MEEKKILKIINEKISLNERTTRILKSSKTNKRVVLAGLVVNLIFYLYDILFGFAISLVLGVLYNLLAPASTTEYIDRDSG